MPSQATRRPAEPLAEVEEPPGAREATGELDVTAMLARREPNARAIADGHDGRVEEASELHEPQDTFTPDPVRRFRRR